MEITDSVLALIAAVFGGVGLKVLEKALNRGKEKMDLAAQIRAELRSDQAALRKEIENFRVEVKHLEDQLDKWRTKYYELLEQFYVLGIKPDIKDD